MPTPCAKLQAVTDTATVDAHWCWAGQVADALTAIQQLVGNAITAGADAVDPMRSKNRSRYRSAVQIGRTSTGAKQFCASRSYLSTAAKHTKPAFEVLVMLAEGRPWLPQTQNHGLTT